MAAPLGWFYGNGPQPIGWFGATLSAAGWFDRELDPVTGGPSILESSGSASGTATVSALSAASGGTVISAYGTAAGTSTAAGVVARPPGLAVPIFETYIPDKPKAPAPRPAAREEPKKAPVPERPPPVIVEASGYAAGRSGARGHSAAPMVAEAVGASRGAAHAAGAGEWTDPGLAEFFDLLLEAA